MINFKNDWQSLLEDEFKKDYYINLQQFLVNEYATKIIYPNQCDIFNALHYTAYQDVAVVLLGQDPYHGPSQAHGLSFSVKPGIKPPPSLVNIYKELRDDVHCYIPNNGYLKSWSEQGVLLLNNVLTVISGQPNSHKNIGWQTLTDKIISLLNARSQPIIFILWGNNAQSKGKLITNPHHYLITSVHPSPLSAHRGFFNSKPFSKTNAILETLGRKTINWQITDL